MTGDPSDCDSRCREVARRLAAHSIRVVFAESCTAGLVSASLAAIPGISSWLCGSLVTYRDATKVQWLGVTPTQLTSFSAVSEVIARQMAIGALQQTPEADLAVSITGHLGPEAPADRDGVVFVGLARREQSTGLAGEAEVHRCLLAAAERLARQREAVQVVLEFLLQQLPLVPAKPPGMTPGEPSPST